MTVHDHRAHVTRAPTWACVCVRGEREVLHGVTRGLPRGLGGVGRLRRDNQPRGEGLGGAQDIRGCLGLKSTTLSRAPPLLVGRVRAPNTPRPLPLAFSRPLQPHPRPAFRPSLLRRKPGERTAPRPASSGHARLEGPAPPPGGSVLPPPGRRRRLQRLPPRPGRHTFRGGALFSRRPELPPTPSLPAGGGGAGGEAGSAEAGVSPRRCPRLLRKWSSAGERSRAPHRPLGRGGAVGGGLGAPGEVRV